MKKCIVVTTIRNHDDHSRTLTSGAFFLHCTSKDEPDIHRAITGTRDPNVLLETLLHYNDPTEAADIKKNFALIREKIMQSDTIKIRFIPLEVCSGNCKICFINAIEAGDEDLDSGRQAMLVNLILLDSESLAELCVKVLQPF